ERDRLRESSARRARLPRRIRVSNEEIDLLLDELSRGDAVAPARTLLEDLRRLRGPLVVAQRALLEARDSGRSRSAFVRWWFLDQRANAGLADLSAGHLN